MMTSCLKLICNFFCCGLIGFNSTEDEESNPLLPKGSTDTDSFCNKNEIGNSSYEELCRTTAALVAKSKEEMTENQRSDLPLSNNHSIGNRGKDIEECRKNLKSQLGNLGQKVKRAKSLPSNTSMVSQKSVTPKYEFEDVLEPTMQESRGDMPKRSPLSHHILRHLTTPTDSGLMMNNVPLWKQLDKLIMDDRPPKMN